MIPRSVNYKKNQKFWDAIYSETALGDAIEWITSQFDPGDIYNYRKLEKWALDNSFIKDKGDQNDPRRTGRDRI